MNKTAAALTAIEDGGVSTDSEESAFMVEEIEAVHHNRKGQYFAHLDFANEGMVVGLDCQLDTRATNHTPRCVYHFTKWQSNTTALSSNSIMEA